MVQAEFTHGWGRVQGDVKKTLMVMGVLAILNTATEQLLDW